MNRKPALFFLLTLLGVVLVVYVLYLRPAASPARVPDSTPTTASSTAPAVVSAEFVTVQNGRFTLQGEPYAFAGVNFWGAMNLAAAEGPGGDRARLLAELDHLQSLGVTNLRVMASSEGPDTEPYRMAPALMPSPGEYNETLLDGLDYLMFELGQREMKAVLVLANYWHWSGGMAQYVAWDTGASIPYPGDWGAFMDFSARFYACQACQDWYRAHIRALVTRTNPYTGLAYRQDPSIFAWELANEPRRYPLEWVEDTAAYIKSLDPNHLVTTGSEGTPPGERTDFARSHRSPHIDYVTLHIWPQNWGWYDPQRPSTYETAEQKALQYLHDHLELAQSLGKPLVLEEFGLARDHAPLNDIYDPASPTTYRDRFFTALLEAVHTSYAAGGPGAGSNLWSWAGSARPPDPWTGDPPHETPGWYSIYDKDESTLAVLAAYAAKMR